MSEAEFDSRAKNFIEDGKSDCLEDLLKEYALYTAYEKGDELKNPRKALKVAGVEPEDIGDFTEYQVAKNLIKDAVKQKKVSRR
ncbi:MAG: hypothetical protein ABEJ98_05415 [Candidatus Nanohaloarchaea archaeon]